MLKMKALRGVMMFVLLAGTLLACNNQQAQNDNQLANDTDGDTTPDTAAKLHMMIDTEDSQFAINALNDGKAEIILGKLAIKQGKSKEIKNFGAMMIKEHTKINDKLLLLINDKKIAVPPFPNEKERQVIDDLSKRSGSDFDKAYVAEMLDEHKKDVAGFTLETKKLQDPELKNFAIKTLPSLQNHLDKINAIHDGGI